MKTATILAPLDLNKMPRLKELFALLNSGRHINRLADPILWAELEREAIQFEDLFAALGYELRMDGRGYAWFQTAEASVTVSKTTRQLALLFMVLFELQADAGLNLGRFTDWHIDRKLLEALWDKNHALLEAEGFADAEALPQLLDTAARYGFAEALPNGWRLLPAVFRYLDRFEELSGNSDPVHAATSVELATAGREDT
jgi:hypothetical protein